MHTHMYVYIHNYIYIYIYKCIDKDIDEKNFQSKFLTRSAKQKKILDH